MGTQTFTSMDLLLKTTDRTEYPISFGAGLEGTIDELKEAVCAQHGFLPEQQTLVFKGKVLKEGSLADNCVDDSNFIVMMVKKIKKPKVAKAPVEQAAPVVEPVVEPVAPTPEPPSARVTSPVLMGSLDTPSPVAAPSEPEAPSKNQEDKVAPALAMVMAVGFSREQAESALQAAQNDPDRAVEFLFMSGATMTEQQPAAQGAVSSPGDIFATEDAQMKAEISGPLAQLASAPEFQHMLAMVRENPEALPLVMQEVEARWPEMVSVLEENQDELQKLLDQPAPETSKQAQVDMGHELARHEEAITNLKSMFPDIDAELVAQAYHQCQCDSSMAANALLTQDMSAFSTE